MLTTF